jgi:hypothetical protein
MPVEAVDTKEWARESRAAWDLVPLIEMCRGAKVQVGFELELYARIPTELPAGPARQRAAAETWDKLREIAESLIPAEPAGSRLETEPFDAAGRLRPETDFAPEVLLKARLFHASDYFKPVTEDEREHLRALEERLRELGLRHRCW